MNAKPMMPTTPPLTSQNFEPSRMLWNISMTARPLIPI
jgi:hypothetical protein